MCEGRDLPWPHICITASLFPAELWSIFPKLCAMDVKSMGILSMHEGKMPLKYWGMLPSLSGPLGLGQAADTIVGVGEYLTKGGDM